MRHFLRVVSNEKSAPDLASEILKRTSGNPLFVSEIAKHLGEIDRQGSTEARSIDERMSRIPEGVRTVISMGLAGLSKESLIFILNINTPIHSILICNEIIKSIPRWRKRIWPQIKAYIARN